MSRIDDLIAEHCPSGVTFEPLAEIGDWYGGGTPSKSRLEYWRDGTIPWVSPKDMGRPIVEVTEDYITEAAVKGSATKLVPANSIAVVVRSSILDRIFPTALIPIPVALNQDMKAVVPRDDVLPAFVAHLLRSRGPDILRAARRTGGSVASIESSKLFSFRVPIPPLPVQREIVKGLNTFTQLEAELEAELEARRRQYKYYRDALLGSAEQSEGISAPSRMQWATLGDIAINLDSQRRPVTKSARQAGEFPYYGASGIVDYVKDYIFDGDYLLVSEDGANLLARSTPIAFSVSGKTWVNNHAHVLQFNSCAERRFVEIYLNSIDLAPYVSGAAQPKLNQANLNRIPVPVLPVDEQARIVGILDKFDALVNDITSGLPAEITARRQQYAHYRDRLLTFREAA